MPTFPAGRVLIVPPSQLWSRGATVTIAGQALTNYPASRATDGYSGRATRSVYTTDHWVVDLGTARTPNVFGVIHSNLARGQVCAFHAAASGAFSPLLLNSAAAARTPNFWVDLRGTPVTARYYRFGANAAAKAISIGEIVIGTAFEFNGVLRQIPNEDVQFWQERALLETGKVSISASGAHTRAIELDLELNAAEDDNLLQIFEEAADSPYPVVVVPDSMRNDLYYVHWPESYERQYPRSDIAEIGVTLRLVEASAGVL